MLEPLFNKVAGLSLFLIKLEAWRPATVLKRGFNTGVFQWNLQNILRTLILKNIYEATASEIWKLVVFRKLAASVYLVGPEDAEAVPRRWIVKKIFLTISQN